MLKLEESKEGKTLFLKSLKLLLNKLKYKGLSNIPILFMVTLDIRS
jgi:hypothetical protein